MVSLRRACGALLFIAAAGGLTLLTLEYATSGGGALSFSGFAAFLGTRRPARPQPSPAPALKDFYKVVFVKTKLYGSAQMRADDPSYFLNTLPGSQIKARSIMCSEFQEVHCKGRGEDGLAVHVKWACACPDGRLAPGMRHVYDPVDAMIAQGGMSERIRWRWHLGTYISNSLICQGLRSEGRCFDGYIAASKKMRQRIEEAIHHNQARSNRLPARSWVVPHHHSNFHNRTKLTDDEPKLIALAGRYENPKLIKGLETALQEHGITGVSVTYGDDLGCQNSTPLPPSLEGDCKAMSFRKAAIGIVWWQPGDPCTDSAWPGVREAALMEKSEQRLTNMLSVGLPTVCYSEYEAAGDAVEGAEFLKCVKSEEDLFKLVVDYLLDAEKRKNAQQESLEVASHFSPSSIAKVYHGLLLDLALLADAS